MNFAEQLEFGNKNNHFMVTSNIKAVYLDEHTARVRWEKTEGGLNAMGGIHGGLLFLMGDCASGLLARSTGSKFVTLDSTFRYLRDGREAQALVSEAKLVKRGSTVTVVRAVVSVEGTDKILAEGEFTFFCIDKK